MKANLKELESWNGELSSMDACGRIKWAFDRFSGGIVSSTSFGLQSAVMIHLISQISNEIPIIFVDTGYLFPATYQYAETLSQKMDFNLRVYSSNLSSAFQEARHGKLWEGGKEEMSKYNFINKREPMNRALGELGATIWLAGLRRSQSKFRENINFIEEHAGIYKLYPILDWDDRTTYQYLPNNDLPYHPLEGVGYESLGDWHSTKKLSEVDKPEDARHGGHGRECGLHVDIPEGLDFNV